MRMAFMVEKPEACQQRVNFADAVAALTQNFPLDSASSLLSRRPDRFAKPPLCPSITRSKGFSFAGASGT